MTERILIAAVGAHMSGLPLNYQLTERKGELLETTKTAPIYRLFALTGFDPPRPGLLRVETGFSIELEVWSVPANLFGSFVDGVPPPLAIGTVELEDGRQVNGFVCEYYAISDADDISDIGSWRAYVA